MTKPILPEVPQALKDQAYKPSGGFPAYAPLVMVVVYLAIAAMIGAIAFSGCLPQSETPLPKSVTATQTTEGDPSKIEPLWNESAYVEQAFGNIYQILKDGDYVTKSNVEPGRFIFLTDPDNKPFYDSDQGVDPVFGKVITYYQEWENPRLLWPLAQEYETLGFLNVFLIGAHRNFPQYARTLKVEAQGRVSAEAKVINILVDENQQFAGTQIEEVHYGSDGEPVFRCTSQFNKDMVKVGETNIVGEKLEEYYFLWPTLDH